MGGQMEAEVREEYRWEREWRDVDGVIEAMEERMEG